MSYETKIAVGYLIEAQSVALFVLTGLGVAQSVALGRLGVDEGWATCVTQSRCIVSSGRCGGILVMGTTFESQTE